MFHPICNSILSQVTHSILLCSPQLHSLYFYSNLMCLTALYSLSFFVSIFFLFSLFHIFSAQLSTSASVFAIKQTSSLPQPLLIQNHIKETCHEFWSKVWYHSLAIPTLTARSTYYLSVNLNSVYHTIQNSLLLVCILN